MHRPIPHHILLLIARCSFVEMKAYVSFPAFSSKMSKIVKRYVLALIFIFMSRQFASKSSKLVTISALFSTLPRLTAASLILENHRKTITMTAKFCNDQIVAHHCMTSSLDCRAKFNKGKRWGERLCNENFFPSFIRGCICKRREKITTSHRRHRR